MTDKTFTQFNFAQPIFRAIQAQKYEKPTPIQAEAIPHLLAGRDLIGCAQTGTGKTAAFALPILQKLFTDKKRPVPRGARVLVLTPTRELAAQVGECFRIYSRYMQVSHALVFGGVGQGPQVRATSYGVDVLVATPGRLIDLIEQRYINLSTVEVLVLDEGDRMLDMGFLPYIKRIIAMLPVKRQTMLFSATMAPEIMRLAEGILKDPVKVAVNPQAVTVEKVDERVLFVDEMNKRALLSEILKKPEIKRTLVFTRTKRGAERLMRQFEFGTVRAQSIHGNKSQSARTAALSDFKSGRCKVLIATDIASRGIDVTGVTHVINYDLPEEPESYVHRIGRTARAGANGVAISFCGSGERLLLRNIERLLKRSVPVFTDHAFHSAQSVTAYNAAKTPAFQKRGGFGRSRRPTRGRPGRASW